jgi:hypothetical protein
VSPNLGAPTGHKGLFLKTSDDFGGLAAPEGQPRLIGWVCNEQESRQHDEAT